LKVVLETLWCYILSNNLVCSCFGGNFNKSVFDKGIYIASLLLAVLGLLRTG
jgi:hypothetical protein